MRFHCRSGSVVYRFEEKPLPVASTKVRQRRMDVAWRDRHSIPRHLWRSDQGIAFAGLTEPTWALYQINDLAAHSTVLGWIRRSLEYGPTAQRADTSAKRRCGNG